MVEFSSRSGTKLSQRVVVGVRPESVVSNSRDGSLIDSGLERRLPDDPGVETVASTPGIGISERRSSANISR